MKKSLSVIIPIYNESSNINLIHERLINVVNTLNLNYEFIYVNDGSVDNSLDLVKQLCINNSNIKYIDLSRNFGHQIAVTCGLDFSSGDKVVIIDADLQDPPELIIDLYNTSLKGFEVVYAKRKQRQGENFFKLITAKLFYRILIRITNISIPVDSGDFRLIDRKVVEALKTMTEANKFLRGQIAWIGFRQTFVEYDRDRRYGGKTGYTFKKMWRLAIDGITSFSDFPLRIATLSGFIFSFVSFVVILYALYSRIITKDYEPGWASIIVSVLFIGGVQLLSIGIIGEYVSRISQNVKKRPLYLIQESNL